MARCKKGSKPQYFRDKQDHWHQQFKKHFIFRDMESTEYIEEGIEILQYSILDFNKDTCEDSGMKD